MLRRKAEDTNVPQEQRGITQELFGDAQVGRAPLQCSALIPCLGRGQEASVKTEKMHGFPPRPHSATQLALAGPDKDGAELATAEAYGPKGS